VWRHTLALVLVCSLIVSCNGGVSTASSSAPAATSPVPPTLTVTSTATPDPTATPTSTPVPDAPCENPLIPLVEGNRWVYDAANEVRTGQKFTWSNRGLAKRSVM
jgi:hypothetical protein